MKKVFYFLKKNSHHVFRVLTYVFSVAVLLYLFPHKGSFPYEFQKGKIWMHEDLVSPFDFPVKKTDRELKYEKDSILKEFKPYFNYLSDVEEKQIKKAERKFLNIWSNYKAGNVSHVLSPQVNKLFRNYPDSILNRYKLLTTGLLQYIYNKGIIQVDETLENYTKTGFSLVILKNKVGEEYGFDDIFTLKSAYEYIQQQIEMLKSGDETDVLVYESGFFRDLDLNEVIATNLVLNEEASKNVKDELIKKVSINKGMFLIDRKVIGKGEVINDEKHAILMSLKTEYENKLGSSGNLIYIYIGHGILISSLVLLLIFFLFSFRQSVYQNNLRYSFVLLLVVAVVSISGVLAKNDINLYIIPFALLPIIIKTFYDSRLALFVHTIAILLTGFMVPNGFEFVFLNFITGAIAIISLTTIYKRRKLFDSVILVFFTYSLLYSGIHLLQGSPLKTIDLSHYMMFAISSSLLLMAYPVIYLFERLFGFLSDITLLELTDTNQPLLRELNEKAPGTFQHSLQVANLAEEAAFKIGANPLMVRAGALYHDIGKIYNPMYFIENLSSEKNPHDSISFEASAKVIIDHVTRGVEIARKHRIPEQIVDFIRTHHGNSTVQFFYISYKKQNPETEIDKGIFTYPGPIPYSKETALVMMADSVEAASRSIKEFNREVINDLVDNIIYYQMINNQYNNSNITYKDITLVKEIFKRKLMNIYHIRVEYPEL